jgi:hypothetical protein
MSNIASVTTAEIIANKQSLDLKEKANQQARELEEITARIQQAESKYADAVKLQDDTAQKTQLEQISFLNKIKKGTEEAQKADTSVIDAKNKQQLIVQELSDLDKRYEVLKSTSELENQIAVTRLDTNSQVLNLQASVNEYSQKYVIALQTSLDKEKALLDSNIAMQQAQDTLNQKREAAEIRIQALTADGAEKNKAYIDAETSELARQETLTNNVIAGLTNQYNSKVSLLDQTKEINTQQAKYNELLQNSSLLATSLADVFGDMGAKIGAMTSAITEFAVASEKNAKSLLDLETKRATITDPKLQLALDEEIATQRTKNTRTELAGNAKLAGSAKNLFKEKTGAYKVFAVAEKGFQLASLALEIKTSLTKLGLWAAEVPAKVGTEAAVTAAATAGAAARAPTTYGEIVGNYLAKIPAPFGMIAGVAAGAFFLSLLGKSGGGGGGGFIPNAEQRQETQGTAMGYNSEGAKVQVRRGVFGDTDAKSESIANSLEIIKDNSVDGLSYNNQMVDLLASIDNGINNTAKGLYGIQGLRSGSMFGTVTGSQSGGGLLGSGFLASKTSRSITDSGLIIEGTFAQLASDTNAAVIDFFEQVTVSKKSWYGKTKTWVEEQRTEIDDATSDFFQDIFGNATKLFVEVGKKAGIEKTAVNQILGTLDIGKNFTSLRGLKGEDFQKELSAVIGTVLDDAALAVFSNFKSFANFGEGMLETVVRVVDTNTKINQQIKNIGINSGELSFAITETLADIAGGLETFLEQTNFFRENFLTEAERLAPVQKAVTEEMARLGFASVDTRQEFKQLVQNLDLTTDAGQQNYQALITVAEGFDQVTTAAEDFAAKTKSMRMSILELTGTPEQLLAAQRTEILGETDERLRTTQQYIFALEDVKDAESNLTKARENEVSSLKQQKSTTDSTINSLKNYINSLKKFKDSLLLGSASPLTPAQRYAESKSQFDAILATAMGTAVTPEEQRTKDAALSQLESSASAFLDASRIYNASSAQYTEDFSLVQSALSNTESALISQLSTEEKSLLVLESQISALESQLSVSKSILTVLEATQALIAAQATASQLKSVDLRQTAMNTKRAVIDEGNIFGAQGEVSTQNILGQNLNAWMGNAKASGTWADVNHFYDNLVNKWGFNSTQVEWLLGVPKSELLSFFGSYNLPAFAMGTNFVPEDMVAQIHQGERIIPAADNMELMASVGNRNKTNEILVAEIRKLNQKIDSLEKTVANGSIINVEATNRNTVEITNSVKDTKTTASYSEALRRRTQVV